MAAIVAHHTLGFAGRAGGVEDIQRVSRLDRDASGGFSAGYCLLPVQVAALVQFSGRLRALQDDTAGGFVAGQFDGLVHQWLVGDDFADLDAATGNHQYPGLGIIDTCCQFRGGETTEHHRVNRTQSRAGQHGDDGPGHHGHVDHHPVSLAHTLLFQNAGKAGYLIE